MPNKTLSILHQCSVPGSKGLYYDPNGYRKVAGDTCIGGISHVGSQMTCPSWAFKSTRMSWSKTVFYFVIIGVIGALMIFTERGRTTLSMIFELLGKLVSFITGLCNKNSPSSRGYAPVSRKLLHSCVNSCYETNFHFNKFFLKIYCLSLLLPSLLGYDNFDDEVSFRKKSTPGRSDDDRTFQAFKDNNSDDEDMESNTMRSRNKQQSALDRVAASLEPLDDESDDDVLDMDGLGDDLDDFNPRAGEPESLI